MNRVRVIKSCGEVFKEIDLQIISAIFLLFTVWMSWKVFHRPSPSIEPTSIQLQQNFQSEIVNYLETEVDAISEVKFVSFSTKAISENQIKAFFTINYLDSENNDPVRTTRKGSLVFQKLNSPVTGVQNWEPQDVEIQDHGMKFEKSFKIEQDSN